MKIHTNLSAQNYRRVEAQTPQSQPEKNDYEATDDSKSLKTDVLILRQEAGKQE